MDSDNVSNIVKQVVLEGGGGEEEQTKINIKNSENQEENPNETDHSFTQASLTSVDDDDDDGDGDDDDGDDDDGGVDDGENRSESRDRSRTRFTELSQVDADWALARTLQEQERAYMMLRMNNEGSEYGSWEAGSYLHDEYEDFDDPDDEAGVTDEDGGSYANEEDAFDVHALAEAGEYENPAVEFGASSEIDPTVYSSDEAFARALQEAEEREMAERMMALAGLNDREVDVDAVEEHGPHSQETWVEIDPDELSYEELLALGEVVGNENRGLTADMIALLPIVRYKAGSSENASAESCVICRLDYEDDETLTVLSCKHSYHSECINNWLQINKVCPVCSAEVSIPAKSR